MARSNPKIETTPPDTEQSVPAIEPKLITEEAAPSATEEELDADEREFREMRRDVDGVKGASGAGTVAISVGKIPEKNAFFRTSRDFQMITAILDHAVGMENKFFAVTPDMVGRAAEHRHHRRGRLPAVSHADDKRRLSHRAGAAGQ